MNEQLAKDQISRMLDLLDTTISNKQEIQEKLLNGISNKKANPGDSVVAAFLDHNITELSNIRRDLKKALEFLT